jgi:hypothetical protein
MLRGWGKVIKRRPAVRLAPSATTPGFHVHAPANIPAAALAGYAAIRMWDSRTNWRDIQPQQGTWNFQTADTYLANSEAAGVQVMWTLGGNTPGWASARPEEQGAYGVGSAAEPASMQDWDTYVRAVATRYKGRVQAYEIWNEVSFPTDPAFPPGEGGSPGQFFTGTAQQMVDLAQVAYTAIKEIDPGAVVLSPSIHSSGHWENKFDLFLSLGGKLYADVISQHFYFVGEPEQSVQALNMVRSVMASNGVAHLPLWDTETGERFGAKLSQWPGMTAEQLVYALTLRTYLLNAAKGVKRVYWYAWDNGNFGFFVAGLDSQKAIAAASAAIRFFNGMWFAATKSTGNLWECSIGTQGTRYKVVWLSGVNPTPQAYTVQRPATRWGIPVETFAAGTQIMLDGRPVIINDSYA